jgi:probable HAF family extracellular repeat protein
LAASHAFLSGSGGGPLMDLGTLGGAYSVAYAVNDFGQVVGLATTAGGGERAFLYSGGQMLDLNSLIAPGSGFTFGIPHGISDTGYIIGSGPGFENFSHAFLLIPVPEPCGLVLLGTGAVALLGYTVRRRARPRA